MKYPPSPLQPQPAYSLSTQTGAARQIVGTAKKLSCAATTDQGCRNKYNQGRGAINNNQLQLAQPCVEDELLYKTFDTNDPCGACELSDIDQRYPSGYF
jgi:hypothetical protein